MNITLLAIIVFLASLAAVAAIHPHLVRFAKLKNIVDNPNTRKLQLRPVPVLGGIAILFGIVIGVALTASFTSDCAELLIILAAMIIMTYLGALDDVLDVRPTVRLAVQIATILLLIYGGGISVSSFHGLWGIGQLSQYVAIPLTIFAAVGIINALNLIDGADGLFSIYCISVCSIFAAIFLSAGNTALFLLAISAVGSLIPFLLHNAFGRESKMFVGDGGSLLMGIMIAAFVMEIISNSTYAELWRGENIGVIPLVLALLSIPVADTLRVMTMRICRGISPFIGDKTHLHHLFIGLGISHISTAIIITLLNLIVIGATYLTARLGYGIDLQLYVVIAAAALLDWGVYALVSLLDHLMLERMNRFRVWKSQHRPNRAAFDWLRRLIDHV